MAEIHFSVSSDYNEVVRLRKECEKLEAQLKKMDVNKHPDIAKSLEKQLEKATRKIKEYQEKYAKLKKVQDDIGKSNNTTDDVKKRTAALQSTNKWIEANTKAIIDADNQIKIFKKDFDSLSADDKAGSAGTAKLRQIEQVVAKRMAEAESIRKTIKVQKDKIIQDRAEEGSITQLRKQLSLLIVDYDNMGRLRREGGAGKALLAQIKVVQDELNKAEQASGRFQRNVGNYSSAFNGLGMSIQQIARELPTLSMGANMFFLAISNNLPIFFDEVQRARKEYTAYIAELKKGNTDVQKVAPVWEQIASGIFSWNTALTVGVTLLTVYGKDIVEWVGNLFKGRDALKSVAEMQDEVNENLKSSQIGNQITELKKLQAEWKSFGRNIEKQNKFIKERKNDFDKLGVSINSVREAENLFVNNTDKFIESLKLRAQATAAQELASEKYKEAIIKQQEAENESKKDASLGDRVKSSIVQSMMGAGGQLNNSTNGPSAEDFKKDRIKNLKEEASAIKNAADAYFNLGQEKERSADAALKDAGIKKSTTGKEEKETKKLLERQQKLYKALVDLRLKNQQDEISLMQDSTRKKIAQINVDYNKEIASIKENEKKILSLYDKNGIGDKMLKLFGSGNVDVLARPLIDAAELVKKGWEDAGEGIATVFSSQYGVEDMQGKIHEILITPILPDGSILSPEELEEYIDSALNGAEDILSADTKGLVIKVDASIDGNDGELLHKLQEKFYDVPKSIIDDLAKLYSNATASRDKGIAETYEEEILSMNNYLSKYGTFMQKIDAITKQYNQKIAKATTEGEKLYLRKGLENAIKELNFSNFKTSINFADIFGNLDAQTTSSLTSLRDKLQEYINQAAKDLKPDDLKELQDAFSNINLKIADRQPFKELKSGLEDYKAAQEAVSLAQQDLDKVMSGGEVIVGLYSDETGQLVKKLLTQEQAEKNLSKAQSDRQKTLATLNQSLNSIGDNGKKVVDGVNSLTGMLADLGVNVSEDVSKSVDGIGQVFEGLANIDLTKPGSIITSSMKIVGGLGKTIGGLFGGKSKAERDAERLAKVTDKIAQTNEIINNLIDKRVDLIKEATAAEREGLKESSLDIIERQRKMMEAQFQKLLGNELLGKKGKNNDLDVKDLGISSIEDLANFLTSDKLVELMENGYGITDKDKWYGIVEEWEKLNDQADKLKETVGEINTGITFDEARDGLDDLLLSADTTFRDISDNFEGYMRKSVLNVVKSTYLNDAMQKWYDQFEQRTADEVLSDEDVNFLRQQYENMYKEAQNKVNGMLAAAGVGLEGASSSQESSKKGFATASQDQIEELNGRFTAGQIAWEETKNQAVMQTEKLSILNIKTESLVNVASDQRNIADETRTILANSYLELQQINENTGAIIKPITEMRDKMNSWDSKIRNM